MTEMHFMGAFLPVGQGLFFASRLHVRGGGHFRWSYDCGTTSSRRLLHRAIANVGSVVRINRLDLCVISHFDLDHIAGLPRLLQLSPARTLLIPYVPLWQRLLLAIDEAVSPTDELFSLYLDPAEYVLSRVEGKRVGRILFVPGSDDEGPADPPREAAPSPPEDRETDLMELEFEPADAPPEAADDPMLDGPAASSIEFLPRNASLRLRGLWEFLPYNDAGQFAKNPDFQNEARRLSRDLLAARSEPARTDMLGRLKGLYDANFGGGSLERNVISLFFYAGPLCRPDEISIDARVFRWSGDGAGFTHGGRLMRWYHSEGSNPRSAFLFTGDGYLDANRLPSFQRFYQKGDRLSKTAIFQVMHHGARANWCVGTAHRIRPLLSIFSSDPEHRKFGHPHGEVLRDFWPYHPVQVDETSGCKIDCWYQ